MSASALFSSHSSHRDLKFVLFIATQSFRGTPGSERGVSISSPRAFAKRLRIHHAHQLHLSATAWPRTTITPLNHPRSSKTVNKNNVPVQSALKNISTTYFAVNKCLGFASASLIFTAVLHSRHLLRSPSTWLPVGIAFGRPCCLQFPFSISPRQHRPGDRSYGAQTSNGLQEPPNFQP